MSFSTSVGVRYSRRRYSALASRLGVPTVRFSLLGATSRNVDLVLGIGPSARSSVRIVHGKRTVMVRTFVAIQRQFRRTEQTFGCTCLPCSKGVTLSVLGNGVGIAAGYVPQRHRMGLQVSTD